MMAGLPTLAEGLPFVRQARAIHATFLALRASNGIVSRLLIGHEAISVTRAPIGMKV